MHNTHTHTHCDCINILYSFPLRIDKANLHLDKIQFEKYISEHSRWTIKRLQNEYFKLKWILSCLFGIICIRFKCDYDRTHVVLTRNASNDFKCPFVGMLVQRLIIVYPHLFGQVMETCFTRSKRSFAWNSISLHCVGPVCMSLFNQCILNVPLLSFTVYSSFEIIKSQMHAYFG